MITYTPSKYDSNVAYFNENNHKGESYCTLTEIANFLLKNDYKSVKVYEDKITLNFGSINGCKSFIDYKSPLFKDVVMYIDDSAGINDNKVVIIQS